MKLVHIIDYFQPTIGYQETFLAKAQSKEEHDVYVVTSDRYAPTLYPTIKNILGNRIIGAGFFIEEGIKVWRLPIRLEILGKVWLKNLKEKIIELKPDILFFHGLFNLASLASFDIKKDLPYVKVIFDSHMVFIATRKWIRFAYILHKALFIRKILQSADALIAVTEETKQFMNKFYGIPVKRIKVIPLGSDTTLFHRNRKLREQMRKKYEISKDEIVFIYAGKLIPVKGPHFLVNAGIHLLQRKERIKVILVGNGNPNYVFSLKKKVKESGFKNSFIFINMVPNKDLYKFYNLADVGVWPQETSLTMIEAMACELPVIIADDSGGLERVNNDNGLIYKSRNVWDLQKKMRFFLEPEKRVEMGRNARKFAEKLDWNLISKMFFKSVGEKIL